MVSRCACSIFRLLVIALGLFAGCSEKGTTEGLVTSPPPSSMKSAAKLVVTNYSSMAGDQDFEVSAGPYSQSIGVVSLASYHSPVTLSGFVITERAGSPSLEPSESGDFWLSTSMRTVLPTRVVQNGKSVALKLVVPFVLPETENLVVHFHAALLGSFDQIYQAQIESPTDIGAYDAQGVPVVVELSNGMFPLPLDYLHIAKGSAIVGLGPDSPGGFDSIPSNTSHQLIMATEVKAYGEDLEITDLQADLDLENGLSEFGLETLSIRDARGVLLAPEVTDIPASNPRLSRHGFSYPISQGQSARLYMYVDTRKGAAGTLTPSLALVVQGLASKKVVGGFKTIGARLNIQ